MFQRMALGRARPALMAEEPAPRGGLRRPCRGPNFWKVWQTDV